MSDVQAPGDVGEPPAPRLGILSFSSGEFDARVVPRRRRRRSRRAGRSSSTPAGIPGLAPSEQRDGYRLIRVDADPRQALPHHRRDRSAAAGERRSSARPGRRRPDRHRAAGVGTIAGTQDARPAAPPVQREPAHLAVPVLAPQAARLAADAGALADGRADVPAAAARAGRGRWRTSPNRPTSGMACGPGACPRSCRLQRRHGGGDASTTAATCTCCLATS